MPVPHICYVDCKPVATMHSVTGKVYVSHVMYPSQPTSAAGRYQWEQNRAILDAGRRAWRASGQGQSRECRVWDHERRQSESFKAYGHLGRPGRGNNRRWAEVETWLDEVTELY